MVMVVEGQSLNHSENISGHQALSAILISHFQARSEDFLGLRPFLS